MATRWNWYQLGLETEAFNTNPHLKQQTVNGTFPGFGSGPVDLTGQTMRVTTLAFNVVGRFNVHEQLQPYVGVGLGVFFAHMRDGETGETSSSTRPGLNTQLGLRYLLTDHIGVFGEWKFNHTRFHFDPSTPTGASGGINGTYNAHLLPLESATTLTNSCGRLRREPVM